MPQFTDAKRVAALVLILSAGLGACSTGYFDRRDSISLSAGDATASNKVTHMVDPWPASSADTRIGFNGQKMQSAVERYRNNQVTPPRGIATANAYQPGLASATPSSAPSGTPVGPTITQPAAAVK